MVIIFYILLLLGAGRCTDDHIFETKTVAVGQNVTLTCILSPSRDVEGFFWIKVVAGSLPKILAREFSFEFDVVNTIPRITSKKESGRFVLHITKTELMDTAIYYCLKSSRRLDITFLKGIFLQIKGPEPDITAIVQNFPSDPVRPGDSVTLQCSVLSDSENKTCPGEHSVYWFRAGSDGAHPSFIYVQRNNSHQCEKSPEAHSPQKCVYNFSKDVSSSDAETFHCAVATCGEILFGHGRKLDTEVAITRDSQKDYTTVFVVGGTFTISVMVIAVLLYTIKRKSCDCCKAATSLQTNAAAVSSDQLRQQRNEDSLVYSTAIFTRRKAGRAERRNTTAKEETVYTDIRAFVID